MAGFFLKYTNETKWTANLLGALYEVSTLG